MKGIAVTIVLFPVMCIAVPVFIKLVFDFLLGIATFIS